MSMATKNGRLVTYFEWFPPMNSQNHKTARSCEITLQTKTIIYELTQRSWLPNLAGWGYKMRTFLP